MQFKLTFKEYNEALKQNKILGLKCNNCGSINLPPRITCQNCSSPELEILELNGRGTIQTYTVINVAPENREQEVPYIVVLVELEEGPWIMGNLGGIKPEEITVEIMGKKVIMEKASVYSGDKYSWGKMMKNRKPTLGFIGAGVTGTALAVELAQNGYAVVAANSRNRSSAQRLAFKVQNCCVCDTAQDVADLAQAVFITTPDDIIADIAASLTWHNSQIVIHCSGAHSIDILEPAKYFGANICCLHPLQTFAGLEQAIRNIAGSTFAIEGDEAVLPLLNDMASAMKGNIIVLKAGDKALYHVAAVTVSNYLVTLMKMAADLWASFGITQEEAVKALLPLLKGTVSNIENVGIPGCLTGPIARGDIHTIQRHLNTLEKEHPSALEAYRALGLKTLSIALAKGRINLETAGEMQTLLEGKQPLAAELPAEFYEEIGMNAPTEQNLSDATPVKKSMQT
ncbi:MAG: DUF2520 domain-containing protein [Chloroflexi bacterium]|nr:DUF2520 domain-containing protein [Chloroflexota bacterium]